MREQLELHGLEECLRRADSEGATEGERRRLRQRVEAAHQVMSDLPGGDERAYLHSGLCQTFLPHSRLTENWELWRRNSGRFTLIVQPGLIDDTPLHLRGRQLTLEEQQQLYVGVPYGAKARLILIYLQGEGVKSRTVSMGATMSAWIRSLGLPVSGGPRGSINLIREQAIRIARCNFTMQWDGTDAAGNSLRALRDIKIVEGLDLWIAAGDGSRWSGTVELSHAFHEHLRNHAVPLDKRAISHLSNNSLGLDLYALFAYRLPRLRDKLHLSWKQLLDQLGTTDKSTNGLGRRIREILPDVLAVYPDAKVEPTRHGLVMRPSKQSVPTTMVNGYRLLEGDSALRDHPAVVGAGPGGPTPARIRQRR